jgi:hypothetical protein
MLNELAKRCRTASCLKEGSMARCQVKFVCTSVDETLFLVLGFKLRVLCLLGRRSTA